MNVQRINDKVSTEMLAAVMPWEGIKLPKAAIVNQNLVRERCLESMVVEKITIELKPDEQMVTALPTDKDGELAVFARKSLSGIIKVGEDVSYKDILVYKTEKIKTADDSEERLVSAIFGDEAERNAEARMPLQDTAKVVEVEKNGGVIDIYLLIRRQLRIGDILKTELGNEVVVAKIVPNDLMPLTEDEFHQQARVGIVLTSSEDLTLPIPKKIRELNVFSNEGNPLIRLNTNSRKKRNSEWKPTKEKALVFEMSFSKVEQTAAEKNYSANTLARQIVSGQLAYGCKISPNMLAGMTGMPKNAQEMLTLKSDDIEGLKKSIKAILSKTETPKAGMPNSLKILNKILTGFGVKLLMADDRKNIRLKKMTDAEIRSSSHGEVTLPDTIDHKKDVPVRGGLFDQKIFGSRNEYECECGKYKRIRYQGITCDRCGVTVESSAAKCERAGHFELAVPVINPIFMEDFESLHAYVTGSSEDSDKAIEWRWQLDEKMRGFFYKEKDAASFFREAGIHITEHSIMTVLPILPTNLRPLIRKDYGHWYTSDLNDLYRRVIIRSNRLKRLIEIKAPEVILRSEYTMLMEGVRGLFNNKSVTCDNERLLRSLDKNLEGATDTLFKKPLVYTGKALVVPATDISVDQMLIPKYMALHLFKPRICAELIAPKTVSEYCTYHEQNEDRIVQDVNTVKEGMKMVDDAHSKATEALKAMILPAIVATSMYQKPEGSPVFGFKPKVWDEEVIGLHPDAISQLGLILSDKFGKVFVSVPLSDEAITEAEEHLISCTPIFKPQRFSSAFSSLNFKMLESLKSDDISISLSGFDRLIV